MYNLLIEIFSFPGSALMKIVEVYKEIQEQQMNIVSKHALITASLINFNNAM